MIAQRVTKGSLSPVHLHILINMLDEEINYMLIRSLDGMNQWGIINTPVERIKERLDAINN